MGERLGYSRNYVHMLEAGLKPISPQVRKRLADLSNNLHRAAAPQRENSSTVRDAYQYGECRYPADCDLSARLDKMQAQLDTLTQLLGASLAKSVEAPDKRKAG